MTNKKIRNFILLNIVTLIIVGLFVADSHFGDGDGQVRGIPLALVSKILLIITGLYDFAFLFSLKKVWLQKLLISTLMIALTIVGLEWFFGVMLEMKYKSSPQHTITGPDYLTDLDNNLGYKLKPNKTAAFKKVRDGEVLYDVVFHTDANSLRVTPIDTSKQRDKYAVFFGCSFTFGEGLADNQTSSYYFQEKNNTFKPYNLGNSAYGPHQMLARLQEGKLKNIVKEKNGIAFFTYIPDHINRAIGGTNSFTNAQGNGPYFVEEHGKMERHKLFKDDRFLTKIFYNLILKSKIFQYFQIGYPFRISETQFEFVANMMAESAKLYQEQFGNDNFYIIFYPAKYDYSSIIKHLKAKNVKVLDYTKLFDPDLPQYHIKHDGHPSALANQTLINQVVKDISIP